MVKAIKAVRNILLSLTTFLLIVLVYGFYALPDEMLLTEEKPANISLIYTLTYEDGESDNVRKKAEEGRYRANLSLLKIMPVKDMSLTVRGKNFVSVSGELFGLRLFTKGIIIVGIDSVGEKSPAEEAGLRKGDIIEKIEGEKVTSSKRASELFEGSGGRKISLEYIRNEQHFITEFSTAYSETDGKYKAGIWIRDSAAGIGTMTFFDVETGLFAGLGHGVCDVDTGEILPVCDGDVVEATVSGCKKGESGKAGELCGVFSSLSRGALFSNTNVGIYGKLYKTPESKNLYAVAKPSEIKKGKAEIIATVDEKGPQKFEIEIIKISKENNQYKNMTIKVTDEKLIERTGGIVQGMSGSPVIQNGMLIGAVTHVFINNPLEGYAIFADTMLESLRSFEQ